MNWKKKDVVLILTVLLIAGAAFGVHEFAGGDGADTVTVKVDGKVTGTYPLAKDQKIRINGGTNILTIKNGKAKMTDADCPDQLCVHQKAASKNHESIICLPNKVVVEVDGSEESEFDAVFTALALIFSYVETLIPINFGIPGVKLGLANLVIVIALYKMKLTEVYLLSVVRVLLSGFIFGNYFSIIYSLAGGLLSLTVMALLKKSKGFSVMGISVAGGVFHNVGQLIVAMLVVETFSVGYYFPVLLVAGLITGLVIGIVSAEMLKRIKNIQF